MNLSIDIDTYVLTASGTNPVLKRYDLIPVSVQFVQNGNVQDLGNGATGMLGIKVPGALAGSFLAVATSWTKTGTGGSAAYNFDLNLNTTEMAAAFSSSPATLPVLAEVKWSIGSYNSFSQSLSLAIADGVITGEESTPASALDLQATDAQAVDSTNTVNWMSPHATSVAIAAALAAAQKSLESIPTVANQAARYALTGFVNGDPIFETDTNTLWMVLDATNLGNSAGWQQVASIQAGQIVGLSAAIAAAVATETTRAEAAEALLMPKNWLACPFPANCSTVLTYTSGNVTQIEYYLSGVSQGFAHITYDTNTPANPLSLAYYEPNNTTQIGTTINFTYDSSTPPNLTGVANG